MKLFQSLLMIPLALGAFSVPTVAAPTQTRSSQLSTPTLIAQAFRPPRRGAPKTTAGGATRGQCDASRKSLTPLLPKDKFGLTVSDRPTLFWSLPQAVSGTAQLTILGDKESRVVYETTIALPKTAGIFQFTLPPDAPALEVGQQYRWYLSINCKADGTGNEISVDGWIERIALTPELTQALKTATPREQVRLYAEAGIWHEAVTILAALRLRQPSDLRLNMSWRELLRSVDLSAVMSEPLVNTCQSMVNSRQSTRP
ncbi:DUF928 domain-containing protein [Leptolyngbya sp. FACHB-17]|uniref:DUF928 domain-containing protein n=1 Tax=unclassified Leptolyngbya TaxID=2650499 RepID=UPI0016816056|nr:DUF928 domain-containing protein [Leptolyngbya sp. FACHB-17]MBD2078610.1 DUF928 domain-containing protein [Leptolyngbya sp. FACHB-17]